MKIAVIADDLTGANATGVLLTKHGFSTATILDDSSVKGYNYDAICIDTDSRYIRQEVAYERVKRAVTRMASLGAELFSKRIDSTVRGNIGTEIDAILDTLTEDFVAVVVPSYPNSGRTTVGGYLLVEGVPVQETDVAKDPQNPLKQSNVVSIISQQSKYTVDHIELSLVLKGKTALSAELDSMMKKGKKIIVIDAVTNEQIQLISETMCSLNHSFVPVDPGPLTSLYVKEKFKRRNHSPKLLVSVGSCTTATGRQLNHLISTMKVKPVYVVPEKLVSPDMDVRTAELVRAVQEGIDRTKNENIILVTTFQEGMKLLDLQTLAKQQNTNEESLAKRITDGLALISQKIIQGSETVISGCFSSGGDVTASICAAGKTYGIQLLDEVFPLAAYGRLIGGYLDGLPIITKGGMVGEEDAITRSVQYLMHHLKSLKKEEEIVR
ncbi:four-carbon acid sugar kinase family protein [Bacillus sp. NEB1478]|uniref:four-carbon acid sugar kinase family protein n=1 Tax=Bacillus sp. NEB1478 TaxID=3073816 RepID=UPI002873E78F|nr:four-carbon acid sugar kinase family protein [Bacillus sp. NEB1478]WNB91764.1 four-carbon acid sugar kinase family protein [Bacillus sp. NEB1478]